MKSILPAIACLAILFTACNSDSNLLELENDIVLRGNSKSDKSLKVFRAPSSIQIDGQETEWADVPKKKLRKVLDLGIPIESKFDLDAYFKMIWDNDNLYIFASITDNEINVSGFELFEKDGFEFYIDGDNSKNVAPGPVIQTFPPIAYDENDDFFRFIPNQSAAFSAWSIIDASNFDFAIVNTDKGYNVEIKMPFSDLPDLSAAAGSEFGFEIQVNDNDENQRQNSLKWNSSLDKSFFDPSLFDTAILFDAVAE